MTSKKDGCTLAHNHQVSSLKKKARSGLEVSNKKDDGNDRANGDVIEFDDNNKKIFKKGPWTAEEDALLIEYVKMHGERHWNCAQKTGLTRCGKSCRLRWTNHLRPDLKKGAFSMEEERIVLDLHAKLGNKWSKIAAELPGRTDNEVKNFWNTKIKRRMKANQLMLNSQGHHPKEGTVFHQHFHHQQKTLKGQGRQELSSIPNAMNNMHSSVASLHTTINSTPMSTSILKARHLGKPGEDLIKSTHFDEPILSFLNNPAYKYQFISEEDKDNEKSSITEEEKCVLDRNITCDESREMATVIVGKKRPMDNDSITTCNDGVKQLKVEPLEDLIAMDDDLSSLLHDFSSIGSPIPLYYANNEASMPHSKEAFEFPQVATIPSESPAATIATSMTSTSEFNCNMDDYC
ncbi:hypothetical protein Cgig2_027792 [Carnegiea gigantea]|uniref:Uncharacterized protein n=1 Tax=Carnegiea gigantea TaxID=171969 RepID=A0A9Q1JHG0_9CARY|nr:hypothetical protein Cgig2_027792 [Carnegiea gigantea]